MKKFYLLIGNILSPLSKRYNSKQWKFSYKSLLTDLAVNHKRFISSAKCQSQLKRAIENPIISPNPCNRWESSAVFNAATLYLDNKVHFIYRAVGESGHSVFGYASSKNGVDIDERSDIPIFVCEKPTHTGELSPHSYASGGSWWGCEDPRLSVIDDKVVMTYTAFDGCHPPCVALSIINVNDFLNQKWNWTKPTLISEPGKMNKNWMLFPEKINNKFAVLHSITPTISIAYKENLDFKNGEYISSYYRSYGRETYWDNWIRGAGPPPLRINNNWLVLYHAMDKNDPDRYKLGALILDGEQPEKILYRTDAPLLEPDMWYENEGFKRGVIYACGTAIIDQKLFVYYGGSDSYVCAASIDMSILLTLMQSKNQTERKSIFINPIKFLKHGTVQPRKRKPDHRTFN